MSLIAELRRRNVIRMAGLYLVGAWLLVQVAGTVLPMFAVPDWVARALVILLSLGFIPALAFAWVFEMTPDGLKRDADVPPEQSIAPQTARRMDRSIIVVLLLALVFVGLDRLVLEPRRDAPVVAADAQPNPAPVERKPGDSRSIAVLPFVDMSQGKDQEYFSDGITEEILNALTRIENLKVAGRTSSFHFKGRNENLQTIGAALGVAHVLEGSVRKQGDRIRITAQLIKVDDGFHVWSENYDRKLDDIFAVQDEISAAIASALSTRLMGGASNPPGASVDPKAYDNYLRARQELAMRTGEHLLRAAALFEAAAILDPTLAAAHSGRARALSTAWGYLGPAAAAKLMPRAEDAAERALALDPDNAEAHSSLAHVQIVVQWQWDSSLQAIRRSVELAPNDAEVANFAGDAYRFFGDFAAAETLELRAIELDPLFDVNHADLAWLRLTQRRCRDAIAPAERAIELDADYWPAHDALARAYICLGEIDAATRAAASVERLFPREVPGSDLRARIAIAAGRDDEARVALAELERRADAGESIHYAIAAIQALLGDHEDAARSLELAYAARDLVFVADDKWALPEDWPDHPAIRAALDKPELNALYEIRRRNFARTPRSPLP